MGAPGPDKARGLMLLCGQPGTGRHFTLRCVAEELAARGHPAQRRGRNAWTFRSTRARRRKNCFLQDLYSALQSDAEVLAFDNYEACAPGFRNMLATLAAEGTLALAQPLCAAARHPGRRRHGAGPRRGRRAAGRGQILRVLLRQRRGRAGRGVRRALCGRAGRGYLPHRALHARKPCCHCGARAEQPRAGNAPPDRPCAGDGRRRARFCRRAVRQDRRHGCDGAVSRHNAPRPGRICSGNRPGPRRRDRRGAAGGKRPPAGRRGLRRAGLYLLALLPQAYRGDIEAVEAELDAIVGLEPVKCYLRELAGNVQAQQRRKAQACRWPKSTAT